MTVRGNNKENVFFDEFHKHKYLSILARYKEKLSFKLYAFCIMDNHAHLLIEVEETSLSQIMQRIQQVFTQWHNSVFARSGHVFEQRYKAFLCDKESYLLQLVKYIHFNPVKSDLDGGIDYEWSSHQYYINGKKDSLVDTDFVLNMFSNRKDKAIGQYMHFLNQEPEKITYKDTQVVQQQIQDSKDQQAEAPLEISIDKLIEVVCTNEKINVSQITDKNRTRRISDIRKAIILLSDKHCKITNNELAHRLNLTPSTTSRVRNGDFKRTAYCEDVMRRYDAKVKK